MNAPVHFVISGATVPTKSKQARVIPGRGFAVIYTPSHVKQWQSYARKLAHDAMVGRKPLDCAIRMTAVFVMPIPQSWSQRKRQQALAGLMHPTARPDCTNMLENVNDALIGIVYRDDSLIVDLTGTRKVFGEKPCVDITVTPLEGIASHQRAESPELPFMKETF